MTSRNDRDRKRDKKEKERIEIARRYLQGESQESIALSMGVTQQQISYDIKVMRQRWKEAQIAQIDQHIEQKLIEIQMVKLEAWKAWQASNTTKETITESTMSSEKGTIEKSSTKREKLLGNSAYLSQVVECIKQEAILLNLPTELKYQDINTAIAKVIGAGFDVRDVDALTSQPESDD